MSYIIFSEWLNKWQILIPKNRTKLICSSPNGEQGKQFSDDSHQPLRLQFLRSPTALTETQVLQISIWRSPTALTASLKSHLNFSPLLNHYWQGNQIKTPALLQVVEGRHPIRQDTFMNIAPKLLCGHIYLINAIGTPRYKIGKTRREPSARFVELNGSQSPYPLHLLSFYATDNIDAQEKRLHLLAKDYRVHGEWFEIPEWWLEHIDKWFLDQCSNKPPSRRWNGEILSNAKKGEQNVAYGDIYAKAVDILLTFEQNKFNQFINLLYTYITAQNISAERSARDKASNMIGFKIPSKLYATTLRKTIKEARKDIKISASRKPDSFMQPIEVSNEI